MKDYASLRKKNNKSSLPAVIILAVCVLLTAALLFSRLVEYAAVEERNYISLTDSSWRTHVSVGQRDEAGVVHYDNAPVCAPAVREIPVLTASPVAPRLLSGSFGVYDENTVWTATTEVEIFRLAYVNGEGVVTVNSGNGDKVIAPGTSNTYEFTLQNSGDVPLEYTLTMNASFTNEEYAIPVVVRVVDEGGNYLLGSAEEQVEVLRLDEVNKTAALSAGYEQTYILEWEWPFEQGDDEYDTLLGDLAVAGEDIALTIEIRTEACWTDKEGGEPPKTGDASNVALPAVLMVASLAGFLLLLLAPHKREEADE